MEKITRKVGVPGLQQTTQHEARFRTTVSRRRGAATLDYVLLLGIILPVAGVLIGAGGWIMRVFYGRLAVLLSWPFM
ncbi:MAG: hypothetical protein CMJ74_11840 [Planctomycetaceae bacterium]|nr:hypothetical protein [Planctomycetaceae bacterium]